MSNNHSRARTLARILLNWIPGLRALHTHATFLGSLAHERWIEDRETANDRSHLRSEWDFESPAEQDRYRQTLKLVAACRGDRHWGRALEIGCSSGHFTELLAQRCQAVDAVDISSIACNQARVRLAAFSNVAVQQVDIETDRIDSRYELVFAMDCLEFVHGARRLRRAISTLADALVEGGILVVTACRLPPSLRGAFWNRWFVEGGDAIVTFIEADNRFQLIHHELGQYSPAAVPHVTALVRRTDVP